MQEFYYTLTLEDSSQIIDWQLQDQTVRKKKKENLGSRIFTALLVFSGFAYFGGLVAEAFGRGSFLLFLAAAVFIYLMTGRWGQKKIRLCLVKRQLAAKGGPVRNHVIFGESAVTVLTGERRWSFAYSLVTYVGSFKDMAAVSGKTFSVYFPVRAVGTEADLLKLKQFVREKMNEEGRTGLDMEALEAEYRLSCPYVYSFIRTKEELARIIARMTPKPYISKAYWTKPVCVSTLISLLITAFFLKLFYGLPAFLPVVCIEAVCWLFSVGNSVYRSIYRVRERELLKDSGKQLNQKFIGNQMMAFGEKCMVSLTGGELLEFSWDQVKEIRECEDGIGFVTEKNSMFPLPVKVFASEGEKLSFLEYCRKHIKNKN